jgi:DNA-binding NtrC family response regulator
MMRSKILVVDDDPAIRFSVGDFLEGRGFDVEEAGSLEEARVRLVQTRPDAMILDHVLPDGGAVDAIEELLELDPDVVILVLTAHGSIDLAVQAIKQGAEQFLTKPIELNALEDVLERCLANRRLRRKQAAASERRSRDDIDPFLGSSTGIRRLRQAAMQALGTDSPILILGETGSGKGVLARWLHAHGPRQEEAFVDLNCAGLGRELLDSELFGHVRGAFTGAVQDKDGLLDLAHRGVLFLDEIGDMDVPIQAKVLKVLEEKRFRRLGDVRERLVDLQLIAATHRDLARRHRDGEFRADLYYRISTIPLEVPPLHQRRDDLPLLARDLLGRLAADLKRGEVELAPDAVERLLEHSWPGNIRELRNVLERAVLATGGGVLEARDLRFDPSPVGPAAAPAPGGGTLEEMEARQIRLVLEEERGHVAQAAERLGIPRSTLYVKLKTLDIDPAQYR